MLASQPIAISNQRAPSPKQRPSFSSGRSRLSKDDFENALLNPNQTVFLSGSPGVAETETPPRMRVAGVDSMHSRAESEKRSFEDDMRNVGTNNEATPERIRYPSAPGVGIVPPTPSTAAASVHSRRLSQATMESDGTPTRSRIKGPSVGIDGECSVPITGYCN